MTTTTRNNATMVIKVSRAAMPNSCIGGSDYHHAAAIETVPGAMPAMISKRARGAVRIVDSTTYALFAGKTARSAFGRELADLMRRYPDARLDGNAQAMARRYGLT